jgi:ABC-type dipeptide/oligopeptide/nickel transport system permease component
MAKFILKRLAFIVPQLLFVIVGTFLLLRILPADPAAKAAGLVSTPEGRAQAARALGVDTSVWEQLWTYLGKLVHWDFATSWTTQSPVWGEIKDRFPVTIQLIVMAFLLALAIAVPIGRAAAARPGKKTDKTVLGYSLFAGAQPDFWWGLLFVFVFAVHLGAFPVPTGLVSADLVAPPATTHFIILDSVIHGSWEVLGDVLWHYCLPVFTLAFVLTGPLIKMTRQSVLGVVNSDYVLYARAIGLPERAVKWAMLRNSLAPVVTLAGILFGFMLGGAVLIEWVFTLDGIGRYALERTIAFDYPAVQGAVILMTAFSLLVYLLMDVIYAWLDPRVRLGEAR